MMKYVHLFLLVFWSSTAMANQSDPNVHYVLSGKGVEPWEFSLEFGKVILDSQTTGETLRGSLSANPATRNSDNDAVRFKWSPKGVENEWGQEDINVMTISLINRMKGINLTPILDQAALTIDVRVLRAPNERVTVTLECAWDWQCRGGVPLKNVLRKIPKKQWISVPIPLRCFQKDSESFDFSDVTSILISTLGKMEIEISDIRLTAFPPEQVNCG